MDLVWSEPFPEGQEAVEYLDRLKEALFMVLLPLLVDGNEVAGENEQRQLRHQQQLLLCHLQLEVRAEGRQNKEQIVMHIYKNLCQALYSARVRLEQGFVGSMPQRQQQPQLIQGTLLSHFPQMNSSTIIYFFSDFPLLHNKLMQQLGSHGYDAARAKLQNMYAEAQAGKLGVLQALRLYAVEKCMLQQVNSQVLFGVERYLDAIPVVS